MSANEVKTETEEYQSIIDEFSAWRDHQRIHRPTLLAIRARYVAEARKRQRRRWHVWKLRHNALMRPGGGIFIETRVRWFRVFYLPSWFIRLWRNYS